jgi:hypothetical protein
MFCSEQGAKAARCPIRQDDEVPVSDSRDIQHGINDPVSGVDVKRKFRETQSPHTRAQSGADVREETLADPAEPFLPEGLRRRPTKPLNSRTGRRPAD